MMTYGRTGLGLEAMLSCAYKSESTLKAIGAYILKVCVGKPILMLLMCVGLASIEGTGALGAVTIAINYKSRKDR